MRHFQKSRKLELENTVLIRKAYKFRLEPTLKQINDLQSWVGQARFVWNKVLRMNLDRLERKQKILYYEEASFWLTRWKQSEEYGFLKGACSHALQQKLKDLDRAFIDAFDKNQPLMRMPQFKKKSRGDSFRIPVAPKIENNRIKLPKLEWMNFRRSRDIEGVMKNATVTYHAGHWYVSIQVEQALERSPHPSTTVIGVDLGIKRFATLSDGSHYEPLNSFKKLQTKLKKEQRKLSKKKKFSANWEKQKARISKLHTKIANTRKDYLHKTSSAISNSHAMIVLEDLKVKNMSKSAKGNAENHGRSVKAKSGLNRSILDQGWSEFRRQLEYKQLWKGGDVIAVNPRNTSRKCHVCQHIDQYNRRSQSEFCCTKCGNELNADVNAAINIREAGHALLACGEEALAASVKQEPTAT
ncbi:MAG: RNA-guided endonuclease InsQ/TnpB family protein [Cellvibrionaceae bacterium]